MSHESAMTDTELAKLAEDVFSFFDKRKHTDISVREAEAHFRALGHDLTRAIEHTLQAYGVVERPTDDERLRWPHPSRADAWRLDGDWLRAQEDGGSMNWEQDDHTVRGWIADVEEGVVSVQRAGHDGTGSDLYEWEASIVTMSASGDAPSLELAQSRALRMHAALLSLFGHDDDQDGRPDFAGFAAALRTEADGTDTIHRTDKTGQARSDSRRLRELADRVIQVGDSMGYCSRHEDPGGSS